MLETFAIIPFDLNIARLHARVWAGLASRRVTVGAHDLLIGATALAMAAGVATRDLRSFPGLKIIRW